MLRKKGFQMNSHNSNKRNASKPAIPSNEAKRLKALEDLKLLDTSEESELNDIVTLASRICEVPISLVSLVDHNRQWFKAKCGLDTTETSREIAFCAHAINGNTTMIVEDTFLDERFCANPLVTGEPSIRFYAGALLQTKDGLNIGTLCVIDRKSRKLTLNQINALEILSRQVVVNFERRKLKWDSIGREKFLNKVLRALPVSVVYLDRHLCFQYTNIAFRRLFNLRSTQKEGITANSVLNASHFEKLKPLAQLALNGQTQDFEMHFELELDHQKKEKIFRFHFVPDRDSEGQVSGFFAVANDLTQLKSAQCQAVRQGEQLKVALQRSLINEKSFRTLFDNTPLGIVQLDASLKVVSVNQAFGTFLGYQQNELVGKSILEFTHPEDLIKSKSFVAKIQSSDFSIRRFEKRYLHKSGKVVWVLVTSRSVQFVENGEYSVFSVMEDITEIRKTEEELKLAQVNLVSASKMALLGEMASGVAHEINNPLAIISGKIFMIKKRLHDNLNDTLKLESDLNVLERSIFRISKIVKGLRLFSRNSKDDIKVDVQVASLIQDTFELCQDRYELAECKFSFELLEQLPVSCRPSEISQVLLNLLNNSCDAIQDLKEKWVSVVVERTDGNILIKVIDSGYGIPNEVVEKMMNPFFTTKEVGLGIGLGLSISKGIAEAHGGKLSYTLENGHTCFVLSLPEIAQVSNTLFKKTA